MQLRVQQWQREREREEEWKRAISARERESLLSACGPQQFHALLSSIKMEKGLELMPSTAALPLPLPLTSLSLSRYSPCVCLAQCAALKMALKITKSSKKCNNKRARKAKKQRRGQQRKKWQQGGEIIISHLARNAHKSF